MIIVGLNPVVQTTTVTIASVRMLTAIYSFTSQVIIFDVQPMDGYGNNIGQSTKVRLTSDETVQFFAEAAVAGDTLLTLFQRAFADAISTQFGMTGASVQDTIHPTQ